MGKYPYTMLFGEGDYSTNDNTTNVLSEIYQYIIETRKVFVPNPERPFYFELWTKETHTPSSGTAITSPLTLDYANLIPVDAAGNPLAAGVKERLIGTVGGVEKQLTITGHTATTISFSDTLDNDKPVYAYHLPDEPGQVVWSLARPDMVGNYGREFIDLDPRLSMMINPYNSDQFVPFSAPFLFPGDWIIFLRLKAAWPVAWTDHLGNALPIEWFIPWLVDHRRNYSSSLEANVSQELIQVG